MVSGWTMNSRVRVRVRVPSPTSRASRRYATMRPTLKRAMTSWALTAPMTATHATTERSLSVTTPASPG